MAFTATMIAMLGSSQQGEFRMTASLHAAAPLGGLKEQANNPSMRSANISVLYGINNNMSVGLQGTYTDFYEKFPRAVYQASDGSDVSAVISNSVQQIPIMASFRYSLTPQARLQPYAGLSAGGNIIMYKQYVGEYPSSDSKVGLAVRPEIGAYWPFRRDAEAGISLGVHYTYAPYKEFGIDNLNYMGVKLGISFPMRD